MLRKKFFLILFISHVIVCENLSPEENAELQETCGGRHRADVNGSSVPKSHDSQIVEKNSLPYVVFAGIYFRGEKNFDQICSGTQISSRHILTAAHCIMEETPDDDSLPPLKNFHVAQAFAARVGTSCTNPEECLKINTHSYKAVKVSVPAHYAKNKMFLDIAVWELDRDIPLEEGWTACIADKNASIQEKITLAGYGYDRDKRGHILQKYNQQPVSAQNGLLLFTGYHNSHEGADVGDSGSGGIQHNKATQAAEVISVVSHNTNSYNTLTGELIQAHTDVRYHVEWICYHTGVCSGLNITDVDPEKLPETYSLELKNTRLLRFI